MPIASDREACITDLLTKPERTAVDEPLPTERASPKAPALAEKADDLEALRTAVTDAAAISSGLWLSYLFVLFYLLVAAGGVTYRALFFASPVKLPFLNVDLPLKGFFWVGPALFLIVHAYVLLHFVMFADKIHVFDAQLRAQVDDPRVRTQLRGQLPTNIFIQYLAGPHEFRDGVIGFLLWLIALISLVIGPVALLVFFQFQFLPYHDSWITWWQRIAVVVDLVLLWTLWPRAALPRETPRQIGEARRRGLVQDIQRVGTFIAMLLTTVISVPLVVALATFPGEWVEKELGSLRPIAPLRKGLVAGKVDYSARRLTSLWSDVLVLPGLDVIDHSKLDTEAKIAALPETASFRARHLEGAVLLGARLRKVDFTAAYLDDALLADSDLREAILDDAHLRGAWLSGAQLQGASLANAQLQGAGLGYAKLHGATLDNALLLGAKLDNAQLPGASLYTAQLQGASLIDARLEGASLIGAELQGANLDHAQLQGALLDAAQLQGAWLEHAQLQSASLRGTFVWRADARNVDTTDARVDNVETRPKFAPGPNADVDWSAESFRKLAQRYEQEVPDSLHRMENIGRVEEVLNPEKPLTGEDQIAEYWQKLHPLSAPELYTAKVTKIWLRIGCSIEGAPYVLTRLIRTLSSLYPPVSPGGIDVPKLAADFLKDECPGARVLSDSAKGSLEDLRNGVPSLSSDVPIYN
jgi:uncharacterized protein YjbI with pentapeptide repeats